MKTSLAGVEFLKMREGLRLGKYQDTAGKWTIGWGHLIREGENFETGITEAQAESLFRSDLATRERSVAGAVVGQISQNQFDALMALVFNIGVPRFLESRLLRYVNERRFAQAADEFLRWCHVTDDRGILRVDRGLQARRQFERAMFLRG